MRRTARHAAAILAALSAGLALTSSVFAATVFLAVVPSTVPRGAKVHLSGSAGDCPRGDTVIIISRAFPRTHEFAGVPAVFATVGARGHFQTTTRIPLTRHAGKYLVTARCGGGNLGVAASLRVI